MKIPKKHPDPVIHDILVRLEKLELDIQMRPVPIVPDKTDLGGPIKRYKKKEEETTKDDTVQN